MAIKEIKREWSPCHCGYVKTFLCHYEKEVADLPQCCVGSRAMVSDTDNEYICTASGWVNAADFDDNGNAKGKVILPETELERFDEAGFMLMTPPSAYPEVGKTYVVNFNGHEFVLPVSELQGFSGFLSDTGNPETTFFIGSIPDEFASQMGGIYVMVETGAETCTLSIVEKPAAVGGGGTMLINMSTDNGVDIEIDRDFSEIKSAIESGIMPVVAFRFTLQALEYVFYLHLDLVGFDGEGYCVQFSAFVKDMNSIVSVLIADDGYAEFNTIQLQ